MNIIKKIVPHEFRVPFKRAWVRKHGNFRQQEELSLISRPHFAYGLLKAADVAKYFGLNNITVCEFGVASGAGLINMIDISERVSNFTGVGFDVFGFDTGTGMPEVSGFKDHPEVWSQGDYPMIDKSGLEKKLNGKAKIIYGDIKETVKLFINNLREESPIGYISIDVDIYTSTVNSLECLKAEPQYYLPALGVYLDDVDHYFANDWCGELAAVNEFNQNQEFRKINKDLTTRHLGKPWFTRMYTCHILDHPTRNHLTGERVIKVKPGGNLPIGVLH